MLGASYRAIRAMSPGTASACAAVIVTKPNAIGMQQKSILVVEDDKDHLTIAAALLRYYGYDVIEAKNATEGIAQALERKPDLILMDLQLPEMNGIEALKVLRSDPRTHDIPAVPYTSFYDLYREQLANLGFHSHIPKTFTPGSLQRAVVEIIGEPNT